MLHNRLEHTMLAFALAFGLSACSQNQDLGVNPVADASSGEGAQSAGIAPASFAGQVMASSTSESEVTLLWPAVDGAVEYRVQYTTGFGLKISSKVPTSDEVMSGLVGLDLTNLIPGTAYTLQVKAIDSKGQILAASSLLQARTFNSAAMAPEAPTQLAIEASNPGEITLSFKDNSLYETSFELLYMDIGANSFKMQRLTVVNARKGADRVSMTVSVPTPCKWVIWVKALGANQSSVVSNGQQIPLRSTWSVNS